MGSLNASCAYWKNTACYSTWISRQGWSRSCRSVRSAAPSCSFRERSLRYIMSKTITLTEAKTHLSHYGRLCQQEPVIVTVKGVPTFQLVPVDEEDDFMNQLIEQNGEFRELLGSRRNGETISADEALRSL